MTVAFEGVDGSGKTTLLECLRERLAADGIHAVAVPRGGTPELDALTTLIKSRDLTYEPAADLLLRVARELERGRHLPPCDVVLLDRGLLTLLAWVTMHEIEHDHVEPMVARAFRAFPGYATVLCRPPFAVSRARTERRAIETGTPLSKKESRGYAFNERIFTAMNELFDDGAYTGSRLLLDTDASTEQEALESVDAFVRRLLRDTATTSHGRATTAAGSASDRNEIATRSSVNS